MTNYAYFKKEIIKELGDKCLYTTSCPTKENFGIKMNSTMSSCENCFFHSDTEPCYRNIRDWLNAEHQEMIITEENDYMFLCLMEKNYTHLWVDRKHDFVYLLSRDLPSEADLNCIKMDRMGLSFGKLEPFKQYPISELKANFLISPENQRTWLK